VVSPPEAEPGNFKRLTNYSPTDRIQRWRNPVNKIYIFFLVVSFFSTMAYAPRTSALEADLIPIYGTVTHTNATADTSAVVVLAANGNRKYLSLYNDSTAVAYCKLGATPTSTSYWLKMAAASFYETSMPMYKGEINCVWAAVNGSMRVSEASL
jgi:hypothetical protein